MARVIQFYIPNSFKPKARTPWLAGEERILEFPAPESKNYTHPTWIFPEVDGDISVREG
jgi:hypothetical protein